MAAARRYPKGSPRRSRQNTPKIVWSSDVYGVRSAAAKRAMLSSMSGTSRSRSGRDGRARRRALARRVWGLLLVGGVVAACNAISGAGDLAVCEGAACPSDDFDAGVAPDAHVTTEDAARAPNDGAPSAPEDPTPDASDASPSPDGSTSCTTMCDGSACCAPDRCIVATGTCGECSREGGVCEVDEDCCAGLVCTTRGRCVRACSQKDQFCFPNGCCLGVRCSPTSLCAECKVHGVACTDETECCSGTCTGGKCVGNTSPFTPPGG